MVERERVKELNREPERAGAYVLYWMQQSQRAEFNPALDLSIEFANRLRLPVVVAFGLTDDYPEANARHYTFMLEGLKGVEASLRQRGISFVIRRGAPDEVAIGLAGRAALVVCDRGYLRHQREWRTRVARSISCRLVEVEGDAVVPVELASTKRELAARTLRPKLLRLRDGFLTTPDPVHALVPARDLELPASLDLTHPAELVGTLKVDHSVGPVARFQGGTAEARHLLLRFLDGPLARYASDRSDPAAEQVSFLSAYLHFGQISPVEIAIAVRDSGTLQTSRTTYLDELIVRRELAINFVEHEPDYDRYACLPKWARETLDEHRNDPRPHLYGKADLEHARTHDPYWNAAMQEMRLTGYMHNHMRMYWGKKILEWSRMPEEGFATALSLNNMYFLCGRDPNSYANVAWCFGLHDRPWPERPIFGAVRSMTTGGLRRKFDMNSYLSLVDRLAHVAV